MNKKRGVTIIEVVVAISLLGVMFLMVVPLIRGYDRVDDRVKMQNKLDSEFSVVSNFIKRRVRVAKKTDSSWSSYAGIFKGITSDSSTFFDTTNQVSDAKERAPVLFLQVPDYESGNTEFEFFIFDEVEKKLKYQQGFGSTPETLMESLSSASFSYREGVVTFFLEVDVGEELEGKIRNSIGDSVVTKIDIILPE